MANPALAYDSTDQEDTDTEDAPNHVNTLDQLVKRMDVVNLADGMDESELNSIGIKVCREAQIDEDSREKWKQRTERGMKLALQDSEPKTFPWPNAANIRAPMMTVAAIQFAARAYPAIVAGTDVVKAQVVGADPTGEKRERADRIAAHMSWQLLNQMPEWEPGVDTMLHNLPIVGCAFKKTYWSPAQNRNRSDYISAMDTIVNMAAPSLAVAPRVTQAFRLYPYEIEERFRTGQFVKFEYGTSPENSEDDDAPHDFYEQHRRWDLDDDGYPEPVIVTVHKDTEKVCRIHANYDHKGIVVDTSNGKLLLIEPKAYFTKIAFIPNPDGGFYDVGFAWLLTPINGAVNTVINQLLDAGTLANTGGGFIGSQLRLKGGTIRFQPGEYKEVDVPGGVVRDNIVTLTFPGPSDVLFKLLGLLMEMGKEIASVKDVLTGESPGGGANTPATTTLALIEQGLKVFTAIYKRIHRAMKEEFGKLYALNREHFDPQMYAAFTDMPQVSDQDYQGDPVDIIPVSDPSMVSDMQRLARAEFLKQFVKSGLVDDGAVMQRVFEAAGITNIPEIMPKQQGPSPEAIAKVAELSAQMDQMHANADNLRASAIKTLAEAEGLGADRQIEVFRTLLDTIAAHNDAQVASTAGAPNANGVRPPAPKGMQSPLTLLGGAPPPNPGVPTQVANNVASVG